MDGGISVSDELGPAKVIVVRNVSAGLDAALVIDNVAAGPAIGGLRMAVDVTIDECARLARAMTLKNAAAGLPHGGGKSVLRGDPRMPPGQKERLIRGFAHAVRNEQDYIFGPDMGTNETCMAWIDDEIGRAVGLPEVLGGIPLDEIGATGWGLWHAADVAAGHLGLPVRGLRVAIQGFGAVGRHTARFLAREGAVIVAVADLCGTVADPGGLDVQVLTCLKAAGRQVCDYPGAEVRSIDAILDVDCDIWIPAARPDVIHEDNAHRLSTKIVLQGANIPCTVGAEGLLRQRGILVIPDFIANAGGVICAAMEHRSATREQAFQAIAERIRGNTETMLRMAGEQDMSPREAATAIATSRLQAAMSYRRFGTM
jgi:glutamate dehydrogenase (NAD(P)+)